MTKNSLILFIILCIILIVAGYLLITAPTFSPQTGSATSTSSTTTNDYSTSTAYTETSIESGNNSSGTSTASTSVASLIEVTSPRPNNLIYSPLEITGKARGSWFFEGVFPIELRDANNKLIVSGQATAVGEWATSSFVQFTSTLKFSAPPTETGTLIFKKDNPSGLPVNDKQISIPVRFGSNTTGKIKVSLFYQNSVRANQLGDQCNIQSVQAVERDIPKTTTPIQTVINLLLQGQLTQAEKSSGFTTEFPHSGFKLKGATLKSGTLTLEFTEVPGFTSGGACRVGILSQEITQTAMQITGVNKVVFKPSTLFQP